VLDDVTCVSPEGNSSTALRRKRPTEAIQTQTLKPLRGSDNGASGKPQSQACQTKVADATNMDIDGVSDQAQHPSVKTENIGLGAQAEPGEAHASSGKTMVAADRQQNHRDAYKPTNPRGRRIATNSRSY
jgi:hypothetical protein